MPAIPPPRHSETPVGRRTRTRSPAQHSSIPHCPGVAGQGFRSISSQSCALRVAGPRTILLGPGQVKALHLRIDRPDDVDAPLRTESAPYFVVFVESSL